MRRCLFPLRYQGRVMNMANRMNEHGISLACGGGCQHVKNVECCLNHWESLWANGSENNQRLYISAVSSAFSTNIAQ